MRTDGLKFQCVQFVYMQYAIILAHQMRISVMVVFTSVRLLYLTYQPVGKLKNEQPHVGRTLIRDVIVMLK